MPRFLLPLVLLLTAACGGGAASDGRPEVVAAAYPFAWAATQVAGPDARVTDLAGGGGEPHDVELAPRQVSAVASADLVVYLSGFQPAVDDAVRTTGAKGALDLRGPARAVPPSGPEVEASESGIDPHVWLDPQRMQDIVRAVRDRLVAADPDSAPGYTSRAESTIAALGALDTELADQLRTCQRRDVVTAHSAFAYLADRYQLEQVGLAGVDPESEPSPGRVAEVARLAKRLGVTTIYLGSASDPGLAQTVAREIGARTAVLDPVEGVSEGDDYLSVMRRNGEALHQGLGCR